MNQTPTSKFSLPVKLYTFFGFVCLSLCIIGAVLMVQRDRSFESLKQQNTAFKQISSFSDAPGYIDSMALAAMDAIVDANSLAVEEDLVAEVDKGIKYFQDNKDYIRLVFREAGKESLFPEYEKALGDLTKSTQSLFEEIPKKPNEKILADYDNKIDSAATLAKNILSEVKVSFENAVSIRRQEASENIGFMSTFSLIVAVCCFVLVIGLGIPLVQSIIKPLRKISDLLNGSSGSLENISESLVSTSNELNDVTSQQSSAVQESVASIAEISATISQTSEHARQSSQQAQTVMSKTEIGAQVMEKMVNSMNSIQSANSQLQNIAKIISEINQKTNVINDIVFKTQLLAFNASIEAARAGQHGRGFAVVANEVGNLAQLSGNAANQIQSLLEDSKGQVANILQLTESRVQEGQSVCREAKSSFEDMFQSIRKIAEQMQSISDAAVEQDVGVKQTTDAMGQIDVSSRKVHQVAIEATKTSKEVKLQCKQISRITFEVINMVGGASTEQHKTNTPAKFAKIKESQQNLANFDADDDSFKDAA